ncbi:MAG: hypothetical protein JNL98_38820 [Bryobacterales bacterium]|nr:hypothetical protein [Bryobacterales bacterium]
MMRTLILLVTLPLPHVGQQIRDEVILMHIADAFGTPLIRLGNFAPDTPPAPQFAPGTLVRIVSTAPGPGGLPQGLELISSADGVSYYAEIVGPNENDQPLAILPPDIPEGDARVILYDSSNAQRSGRVRIVGSGFRMLYTPEGSLAAAAERFDGSGRTKLSLTSPAIAGDFVSLRGSGLGRNPLRSVEVIVGGVTVRPEWAAFVPGLKGYEEVRFRMLASVPDGCYVPVSVRVAGVESNTVRIPKSTGRGACAHPFQLSLTELGLLDMGRQIPLARLRILTLGPDRWFDSTAFQPPSPPSLPLVHPPGPPEAILTFETLGDMTIAAESPSGGFRCYPPWLILTGQERTGFRIPLPRPHLDAGLTAMLQSPAGSRQLAFVIALRDSDPRFRFLDLPPASFLSPGSWRLTGQGGKDVESFDVPFRVPPVPSLASGFVVPTPQPGRPTRIDWNTAGYTSGDMMTISMGESFCHVPATAGAVDLPPQPPSPVGAPAPALRLTVSNAGGALQPFRFRLTNGNTGVGVVDYSLTSVWAIPAR